MQIQVTLLRYILVIALQLSVGSVFAQLHEFQCSKAFEEMTSEYPKLVCTGNDWLERGKPDKALEQYLKAARESFFESPNFLIYYRIAAAQSALGDRVAATQTLKQFNDMLAIYVGEKTCSEIGISPKAVEVMCSEAFGPDSYGAEIGLRLRKDVVKAYREKVSKLRRSDRLKLQ